MQRYACFLAYSILIFSLVLGPSLYPSSRAWCEEKLVSIDFNNVDIRVVAKYVSELTQENFIVAEEVQGTVTIISPRKVSVDDVYRIFQSVLDVNGFTTIRTDTVIKIVAKAGIAKRAVGVGKEPTPLPRGDEYVTRLIPLAYVDAEVVQDVLAPLVSDESHLATYLPTNMLIVTDVASNIDRLMQMIKEVDVEAAEKQVAVIPLEHIAAGEMAEIISSALEMRGEVSPPVVRRRQAAQAAARQAPTREPTKAGDREIKLIPYGRTNSLIVVAPPRDLATVRSLAERLDVPATQPTSRINVYYLEYADAEKMAEVLTNLVSKRTEVAEAVEKPAEAEELELRGEIHIEADPSTNSLVILAAPRDYEALRGVIEKLDVRREQVYVEALIAEISYQRLRELGTQLFGSIEVGDIDVVGSNTFGDFLNLLSEPFPMTGGLVTSLFNARETVTLPDGRVVPTQAALFRALSSNSNVNVLSAPHLLTSDNEEAEIVVAENVPFIIGTERPAAGGVVTSVSREDVGITLRLTPQLTAGDYMNLEIFEEIADVIPSEVGQDPNVVGPTTARKAARSNVTVKDGQTIVIGGLLEDSATVTEARTPCLGSVPLAGYLFRSETGRVEKTNLVIFITPHIMRTEADLERIRQETDETRQELMDQLEPGDQEGPS